MTLTLTLPADAAKFVQESLAKGYFPDAETLLVEAVRCYVNESAFLEEQMTPETIFAVRKAAEELDRNPSRAIPIEDVMERFRNRGEVAEKLSA